MKLFYIIAALLALTIPVSAQEHQVEVATGLICDEASEVVAFNDAWKGDTGAALNAVNGTASPPKCGVLAIAFIREEKVATVMNGGKVYDIVRIVVIAINAGMGWMRGQPLVQFTLMASEEKGA